MIVLADLFLNSTGRIPRVRFALGAACLLLVWAAVDLVVSLPGWLHHLIAGVLIYGGFCLLSQRLHDRGRSGWWSGPILAAVALAWPQPHALIEWAAAALLVVVAIDLLILPGQTGFNRYGGAAAHLSQTGATPD